MNQEDLLNVIGEATEEMLERSEKKTVPVKRIVFAAVAACLALVITILLVAPPGDGFHIVDVSQQERDAEKINEVFACVASIRYNSKEEYDAFMAGDGAKLPQSFVGWEEISVLGEVKALMLLDEGCYMYKIEDVTGYRFYVEIDPSPSVSSSNKTVAMDKVTLSDLGFQKVTHSLGSDFVLERNGCQYSYRDDGTLYCIELFHNGILLRIADFQNYSPDQADTIVSKLLSADDSVANAAFAEIQEKLSK